MVEATFRPRCWATESVSATRGLGGARVSHVQGKMPSTRVVLLVLLSLSLRSQALWADSFAQAALAVTLPGADARLIMPRLETPLRDPSLCRGPQGQFYLTGTTGTRDWASISSDVALWRSTDLIHWQRLGSLRPEERDGLQHWIMSPASPVEEKRPEDAVLAPEIHYLNETYYLCYTNGAGGIGLLESTNGEATGPYRNLGQLVEQGSDPTLFAEGGRIFLLYGHGMIARLSDDLRSLQEDPRPLGFSPGGYLEGISAEGDGSQRLGLQLRQDGGVYQLSYHRSSDRLHRACDDVYVAHARSLFGPYQKSYLAIPHAAGTCLFRNAAGDLMATFSGSADDALAAFQDRFGLLEMDVSPYGRIRPGPLHLLERGTVARLRPLLPTETICNPSIAEDGRGTHYLVATPSVIWDPNVRASVRLWNSSDLKDWAYVDEIVNWLDMVAEPYCEEAGAIVSAEIQYLRSRRSFYLVFTTVTDKPRTWLFRSISGQAKGPYENATDGPLLEGVDGYLFEDEDEKVYFIWNDGQIARMNERVTGLTGRTHRLQAVSGGAVGDGGCSLMRWRGQYVLGVGQWSGRASEDSSYDLRIGTSKRILGPYRMQPDLVPHAGHATLFASGSGKPYATFSGHDKTAPFRNQLGILALQITPLGEVLTLPFH